MNSHFSSVLVTCRSSESSSQSQAFFLFSAFLETGQFSRLQGSAPSQESFGESSSSTVPPRQNFSQHGGLPARTLAQVSTHLILHWSHWEPSSMRFLYSWRKMHPLHNGGDFLIVWKILLVMKKDEVIMCFKHLLYKLSRLSCPKSPRNFLCPVTWSDRYQVLCVFQITSNWSFLSNTCFKLSLSECFNVHKQ